MHVCTELRWRRLEITGAFVCKAGGCGSLTEVMRHKPTTIMQEAILKRWSNTQERHLSHNHAPPPSQAQRIMKNKSTMAAGCDMILKWVTVPPRLTPTQMMEKLWWQTLSCKMSWQEGHWEHAASSKLHSRRHMLHAQALRCSRTTGATLGLNRGAGGGLSFLYHY